MNLTDIMQMRFYTFNLSAVDDQPHNWVPVTHESMF